MTAGSGLTCRRVRNCCIHLTANSPTPAGDLLFGLPASFGLEEREYDPVPAAAALGKPMLILQGDRDYADYAPRSTSTRPWSPTSLSGWHRAKADSPSSSATGACEAIGSETGAARRPADPAVPFAGGAGSWAR